MNRAPIAAVTCAVALAATAGCHKHDENKPKPYVAPPRVAYDIDAYGDQCASSAETPIFDGSKPYEHHTDPAEKSKLVLFEKYTDDKDATYHVRARKDLATLSADKKAPGDVELIVCVDLKKKTQSKGQCNYYGGTVYHWVMTHDVRVIEAKTGKVVAKETFDLDTSTTGCNDSEYFKKGSNSMYNGADYGRRVLAMVLPLEPDGVELPALKGLDLDDVCAGIPAAQVSRAKAGEPHSVRVVYRPAPEMSYSNPSQTRPKGLPDNAASDANPLGTRYVACVTGKPGVVKRKCEFTGGRVLALEDGDLDVQVYEAATGKLIETKTVHATSSLQCPLTHTFWGVTDPMFETLDKAGADYFKELVAR
jgi:hypothetical protein